MLKTWCEANSQFRWCSPVALAIASGLVVLGVEMRTWLSLGAGEYPFLTFIPTIVIGAIVLGTLPALLMLVVCMTITIYCYIPPVGFVLEAKTIPPLALVGAVALGLIYAIEVNRRNLRRVVAQKAALDRLLADQQTMFAELQHRVANNMQFLAAMMRLQKHLIADGDINKISDLYTNQITRIEAMGRLHRELHNPAQAHSPLIKHLEKMCGDFVTQVGPNVRCDLEGDDTRFDLSRLTALTMLVMELMTNSFKYAFGDRDSGVVAIRFETTGDVFTMTFYDDGPGMKTAATVGLGSKIIVGLVRQLRGHIEFPDAGSSKYVLTMPV